jgi:site-specific recombinase XerD
MDGSHAIAQMRADLRIQMYAPATQKAYLAHALQFEHFWGAAADELGADHIRSYLCEMLDQRPSRSRFVHAISALRFLFHETLGRHDRMPSLRRPRASHRLPTVLSKTEIRRLLRSAAKPTHRLLLMTAYSGGLRVSELVHLRWEDVDRERMVLNVRSSKNRSERLVMLAARLLPPLDRHRRATAGEWIFRGRSGLPLSTRRVQGIVREATLRAGIEKRVTTHTLRHSFATHLMDDGADLQVVQALLGHQSLTSTLVYVRLSTKRLLGTPSPLDTLRGAAGAGHASGASRRRSPASALRYRAGSGSASGRAWTRACRSASSAPTRGRAAPG